MQFFFIFLTGFILVAAGLLFVFFAWRRLAGDDVSHRLHDYVAEPAFRPQRPDVALAARRAELRGSFGARTLLPGFRRVGRLFGRLTPASAMEDLGRQLAIAGNPLGLGPREFYGLRLAFTLLGIWLAFTFLRAGLTTGNLLLAVITYVICTALPKFWLRGRVRRRQDRIRKGMADALDMLSVCAEAGLGFDQALQRVSEHWQTPVGIEFGRVVSEMEMGSSRAEALRNIANRLDISELSSFVAVVLQSDQLGMSIADTLHSQARQMRIERRFRAQEQARKLPLKMLFPMMLLIFPAMMAVILGPLLPVFQEVFSNIINTIE